MSQGCTQDFPPNGGGGGGGGGGVTDSVYMAVAAERVPLSIEAFTMLLPCVLNVCSFVAKFSIFVAFVPFHSCQISASLCI